MSEENYLSNNGISNNQNNEKNHLNLSSDFHKNILNILNGLYILNVIE